MYKDKEKQKQAQREWVRQKRAEQGSTTPVSFGFDNVHGATVYGRQAVSYTADTFETRPEPLHPTDEPSAFRRSRFTRRDGTEYQFDCSGKAYELADGLLYQTLEEVRACYN